MYVDDDVIITDDAINYQKWSNAWEASFISIASGYLNSYGLRYAISKNAVYITKLCAQISRVKPIASCVDTLVIKNILILKHEN